MFYYIRISFYKISLFDINTHNIVVKNIKSETFYDGLFPKFHQIFFSPIPMDIAGYHILVAIEWQDVFCAFQIGNRIGSALRKGVVLLDDGVSEFISFQLHVMISGFPVTGI